jgi:hypothetical protein
MLELNDSNAWVPSNRGWIVDKRFDQGKWFYVVSLKDSPSKQMFSLPELDQCRRKILDQPEILLLNPGERIAILMDWEADPSLAREAKWLVEKVLTDRGVVTDALVDDQLRIISTVEEETVQELLMRPEFPNHVPRSVRDDIGQFRRFRAQHELKETTVRRVLGSLELVKDGSVVWKHVSRPGKPASQISAKPNETAQQALDRYMGDPLKYWKSLRLPKHIAIHPEGKAWFRFKNSEAGPQPLD